MFIFLNVEGDWTCFTRGSYQQS